MKKTSHKKQVKKGVTLDDLAVMVAEGREETNGLAIMVANCFERVDKRFDKVEDRLEGVEDRLEKVEDRLEGVEDRLEKVEGAVLKIDTKVNEIDKRLKEVEKSLEPLSLGYRIMSKELQELNSRVFHLEKKAGLIK